jgi:hypothetical protein
MSRSTRLGRTFYPRCIGLGGTHGRDGREESKTVGQHFLFSGWMAESAPGLGRIGSECARNVVSDRSCSGPKLTGGPPDSALASFPPLLVWRFRACFLGFSHRREIYLFWAAKAESGPDE